MKIKYDTSADAVYIKLKSGKIHKTKNFAGYFVDYDKKGNIIGFEVLNYSKMVPAAERQKISVSSQESIPFLSKPLFA